MVRNWKITRTIRTLFPLQYNHSMKSIGVLITTKVIGQSTAESMSKCVVTFCNLQKAHDRDPANRLRLHLGSIWKRQAIIILFLVYIYWDLSISVLFFYPVYLCTYKNLWLTLHRIFKEHLTGIIKEKKYRDIKIHAVQWKSIKNDCHKFILS